MSELVSAKTQKCCCHCHVFILLLLSVCRFFVTTKAGVHRRGLEQRQSQSQSQSATAAGHLSTAHALSHTRSDDIALLLFPQHRSCCVQDSKRRRHPHPHPHHNHTTSSLLRGSQESLILGVPSSSIYSSGLIHVSPRISLHPHPHAHRSSSSCPPPAIR